MIKLTAKFYSDSGNDTRCRRDWPKYSTQLLNLAAQNAQCTRPTSSVGSLKEMWNEFSDTSLPDTLENWEAFYADRHGTEGLDIATEKLYEMIQKMGISWIDETLCADYVREIVYNKTHFGLGGESTAIAVVAAYFDLPYRFSNAEEESQGIDAWIGEHPVQVKPADSYKKNHVFNGADTEKTLVITYEKKKHTCYIWNPEFVSA